MNGGFFPTTMGFHMPIQTRSTGFQKPFFFGGSQVPAALMLRHGVQYHGSGFHYGSMSKSHPNDLDFTTKFGDKSYHRKHHDIETLHHLPFQKGEGLRKGRKRR